MMMLSQASKIYQRSKRIKPLSKKQRLKVYDSKTISVEKKICQKKFSPFNTVSRQSRHSYLLRVTKQPNTQTNYQPNHTVILTQSRRATIDQAKFQRIIGNVKNQDYSLQIQKETADHRCLNSLTHSPENRRPLTVRDHQRWRKTHEHFDFKKQQSTNRIKFFPKLSLQQSTNPSFMKSLKQTIESNFNNYERFKLKPNNKSHQFDSNSAHQYLKQLQIKQKSPEYDILGCNQGFIKTSMNRPKGSVQFARFKQKIMTRFDRINPQWHTILQYQFKQTSKQNKICFDNQVKRQQNDIHSKYPIRLSLQKIRKIHNPQIGN